MAGGEAVADLLLGDAEPGGRLPVAVPRRREDLPVVDWTARTVRYGRWWGQRKLDRDGTPAAYPFGFGLGYTTFRVEGLEAGPVHGEHLPATVTLTNTGTRAGRHIVQIYARMLGSDGTAVRALVGFRPVELSAGESPGQCRLQYPPAATLGWHTLRARRRRGATRSRRLLRRPRRSDRGDGCAQLVVHPRGKPTSVTATEHTSLSSPRKRRHRCAVARRPERRSAGVAATDGVGGPARRPVTVDRGNPKPLEFLERVYWPGSWWSWTRRGQVDCGRRTAAARSTHAGQISVAPISTVSCVAVTAHHKSDAR
ncbi:glycoside hydrolase family 3 C-terminal domain-containing protein [Nocardia nova]|uniref:glycoside hydrolase family 3 C-terminal domain-containing protein n=1 Tax=Nocardia nova TaxID=37330 RepID=UPI002157AF7A|nr:glycoside hydrolase family 3 C-terminal domain-containing protein [Nocardia nova]